MVTHTCDPRPQEVEAGGQEFRANLSYALGLRATWDK